MPPALSNVATFAIRDEKLRRPEKKEVLPLQEDKKISYVKNANDGNEF